MYWLAVADRLSSLSGTSLAFLAVAVGLALAFEFVNGFHDTANAVATVIYTRSLPPWAAVAWSGAWNFVGVMASGTGVAFAVLALLPAEMLVNVGSADGFAMVFALLLSAIAWNLGTWYLGLPASSSHTLIGAVVGVGLAHSLLARGHTFGDGVNWAKVWQTFLALLVSPAIGFALAGLLLLAAKLLVRWPKLYAPPVPGETPPWSVRGLLVFTCTAVSFGHGSNDGQKGMGLLLLILVGILPGEYALNLHGPAKYVRALRDRSAAVAQLIAPAPAARAARDAAEPAASVDALTRYVRGDAPPAADTVASLAVLNRRVAAEVGTAVTLADLSPDERATLRRDLYLDGAAVAKLARQHAVPAAQERALVEFKAVALDPVTQFIPPWVKVATAVALGLGTTVGWKRIVVTVGEKIGKTHLTYGQGAAAELVAAVTIFTADRFHLPVSTTHVLSSGVAGTMAANGSGLQMATLRNVLLAWVLTLPVCVCLGAMLFAAGLLVVLSHLAAVITAGVAGLALCLSAWRLVPLARRRAAGDVARGGVPQPSL